MGELYDDLKFCEKTADCLLEGSRPRGAAGAMVADAAYPKVVSLFTCPPGEPPPPQGDVRQTVLAGFKVAGFPDELSAEDDADLTRFLSERFRRASEAWVFRVNFCRGFPIPLEPEEPEQPEQPPAPKDPAPGVPAFPVQPTQTKARGVDLSLVTMAAVAVGLVVINKARAR